MAKFLDQRHWNLKKNWDKNTNVRLTFSCSSCVTLSHYSLVQANNNSAVSGLTCNPTHHVFLRHLYVARRHHVYNIRHLSSLEGLLVDHVLTKITHRVSWKEMTIRTLEFNSILLSGFQFNLHFVSLILEKINWPDNNTLLQNIQNILKTFSHWSKLMRKNRHYKIREIWWFSWWKSDSFVPKTLTDATS